MPTVTANGAELYYEIRGSGPSVLLIAGLDGGTFTKLAEILAHQFTVVLYDRRGMSRSPRPKISGQSSISEQADDAAALIHALGLAPAAVVGNSLGALITLEVSLRHPDVARGAILLDAAPLDVAVSNRRQKLPEGLRADRTGAGDDANERFESFLRFTGAWDAMDVLSRERALSYASVFLNHEMPMIDSYLPDEARLKANHPPIQVAIGEASAPPPREMAGWLASHLNVAIEVMPGGHVGYIERPDEVAHAITPFLLRLNPAQAHRLSSRET